jgi:hypothetical protein
MDATTDIPGFGPMSSEQIEHVLAPNSDDEEMMSNIVPSSVLFDLEEQMELQSDVVSLKELEEGISDVKGTSQHNSDLSFNDVKETSAKRLDKAMETSDLRVENSGKGPDIVQQNLEYEEVVEINVSQSDLFDETSEVNVTFVPNSSEASQEVRRVHKPNFKSGPVTSCPSSSNTNRS